MSELRDDIARELRSLYDEEYDGEGSEWSKMADAVLALLGDRGYGVVRFTAMSDDARLVLHKIRVEGPLQITSGKFAEGSEITECHLDLNPLPGVPFIAVSVDGNPLASGEPTPP